ncbi:Glycoside Hydrolase Family 18 [Lecanosticta acicola]|uniref:chitinase n=1 Tax=Lecanosticta acicola TaxID=111012 RepID=A0AAI9E764_9PEZI|nr:Glycoside Hydrolase Family 18 [Lecanosticta acicola]
MSFFHNGSGHGDFVLGAYYPAWSVYNGAKPSDLRLSLLTHVYYAFARVKEDGTVFSRDPAADFGLDVAGAKGCLAAFVKLRREQQLHFRLILSIGGASGSSTFATVAADRSKTQRFFDWEHPSSPEQGQSFATLLTALRVHLPSPRYTLTAALPAAEWCLQHIDLAFLLNKPLKAAPNTEPVLDHLNIMAYDFAGPWTNGQSGHHAQLYTPPKPHNPYAKRSIAAVTQYLVQKRKCDPRRLVIGIPLYGRSFRGVDGPGQHFTACGGDKDGTFRYADLPLPGSRETFDTKLGAASCMSAGGGWVSYDCPETVRMKGKFVRDHSLGGMFFWTAANDAISDERSLFVAGKSAMGM